MNIQIVTVISVIIVLLFLGTLYNGMEGYSSLASDASNYYNWRPYAHNVYDEENLMRYPYDYKPYDHPQRFNCNRSDDYKYGTFWY